MKSHNMWLWTLIIFTEHWLYNIYIVKSLFSYFLSYHFSHPSSFFFTFINNGVSLATTAVFHRECGRRQWWAANSKPLQGCNETPLDTFMRNPSKCDAFAVVHNTHRHGLYSGFKVAVWFVRTHKAFTFCRAKKYCSRAQNVELSLQLMTLQVHSFCHKSLIVRN